MGRSIPEGWGELALAFAAFFASHSLPLRPAPRAALTRALGRRGFTLAYSALSTAMLVWLIVAAGRAPHLPLWGWAEWLYWMTHAAMLAACLLLALSIGRPNPFSFGGARNEAFDPARPGVVRWTRHPLLAALALWALGHIAPNGDVAHLLLFGLFAAFALLGGRLIDRRKRREFGARWMTLRDAVAAQPRWPAPESARAAALRLALGVALYGALALAHPVVIGVSPLP